MPNIKGNKRSNSIHGDNSNEKYKWIKKKQLVTFKMSFGELSSISKISKLRNKVVNINLTSK